MSSGGYGAAQFGHVFTHENPGKIEDFYKLDKKQLGEGSYGSVVKADNKSTNATRAIKMIARSKVTDEAKFDNEIKVQSELDHPNIVKLYEVYKDKQKVYLVMEICDGGELFDRIIEAAEVSEVEMAFDERQAATYMQQICGAMRYLHGKHIAHRDIKPENFLMENKTKDAQIKVIDFGLASSFSPGTPMKTKAGTPYYVAPQVLAGSYDEKCDVWSCGVIVYILLSGVPPFYGDTDPEILRSVKKGAFDFPSPEWDNISRPGKDFITKMLTMKPESRPPFDELIKDSWLTDHAEKKASKLHAGFAAGLQKFNHTTKFKKLALTVIAQQLNDSSIQDLKETFQALDKNNDGTLTIEEITSGLKNSKTSIDIEALKNLDTDGSGVIDYTEFIAATIDRKKHFKDSHVWAAFRVFDVDGDGVITKAELGQMIKSDDEIAKMIVEVDTDGDGQISFEEFRALFKD